MTQKGDATLRDVALSAYDRFRAERFGERERYRGVALRDALRLKLERAFGAGYEVVFGASGSERELFAEIDGLRFLGIRLADGDVCVVWVSKCQGCGEEKGGRFLNSLTDLGEEISEFNRTRRPAGHQCAGVASDPPTGTPPN